MAYTAACFAEAAVPGSFQKTMDSYFTLNNIPVIKHPAPMPEAIKLVTGLSIPVTSSARDPTETIPSGSPTPLPRRQPQPVTPTTPTKVVTPTPQPSGSSSPPGATPKRNPSQQLKLTVLPEKIINPSPTTSGSPAFTRTMAQALEEAAALTKAFPIKISIAADEIDIATQTLITDISNCGGSLAAKDLNRIIMDYQEILRISPHGNPKSRIRELDIPGIRNLAKIPDLEDTHIYFDLIGQTSDKTSQSTTE